jgi:16S rRNA (cytidine1402-2'-O)-methyltransferase
LSNQAVKLGKLYLVPTSLGQQNYEWVLPIQVTQKIHQLNHFVVENEKTARQFLANIQHSTPIRQINFTVLDEHTLPSALEDMLTPLFSGFDVGVLSEAGCPAIADPGADLVQLAQRKSITCVPLVGPSSIILSLMASGLNGQQFAFHGYLPAEKSQRIEKITALETESKQKKQTQIFIETPYRNQHLFQDLISNCRDETRLCVAKNISLSDEWIVTKTVKNWRQSEMPELHKQPAIFLLLA